jgi:hypothetical protein
LQFSREKPCETCEMMREHAEVTRSTPRSRIAVCGDRSEKHVVPKPPWPNGQVN